MKECNLKPSGIGGQAVMEGVMMRNKDKYAVAVRKTDKNIVIKTQEWKSISEKLPFLGWPFIRGSVNLIESMIVGMRTLSYSAEFFDEEEPKKDDGNAEQKNAEQKDTEQKNAEKKSAGQKESEKEAAGQKTPAKGKSGEKSEGGLTPAMIAGTVMVSLLLTIALFVFLPLVVSEFFTGLLGIENSAFLSSLLEGVVRICIFIGYVALISLMPEIKRVFCYHGAEHKTINCIEHGLPLTVENARMSSKEHKRCGTSFMIIVMVISILVLSVANVLITPLCADMGRILKVLVRFGIRLLLLPVVAGFSYEFLKLAGRSESRLVNILSRPGMWMQALTTKEPDDEMLAVAIASVEAVFDWQSFLQGETGAKEVVPGVIEILASESLEKES